MIGYYVHHHGVGHLTRARSVARALAEPVTVLSSRPRPSDIDPFAGWITLPLDTPNGSADPAPDTPAGGDDPDDPTAHGVVHWAPTSIPGMTDRMAALARFVDELRPRCVVVDVSVEVAMFVRLMGVRVVVFAMPGERTDAPHQLAYRVADRIVAPWSASVYRPEWLREFEDRTVYAGSISAHADRARAGTDRDPTSVVVLAGAGGSALTPDHLARAGAATPTRTWRGVGAPGTPWVDDVWPLLTGAGVVVTHGGQNAVADVAASGAPAVVVAESRPHGEQLATTRALGAAGLAISLESWPDPDRWPEILNRAGALTGDIRARTEVDGAARRAAAAIEDVWA
ncbi:hypothetical protein HQ314_07725 [Rhodococcus sp. BP-332]|uniref:glycosyltransferase n=1 Tax=Rhodococcus sp. BP-332 TaxID=2739447 RepID=UPI001C9B7905|nr:glycosyltransferase [Rhodococcus sp. BP-332]MBY6676804.1 hypothetical protein [Rhodococcus sp. BP-332]